jgi:hypothetical protein
MTVASSAKHADAPMFFAGGAHEDLAALGILAARLSTGLSRLAGALGGHDGDEALSRWLMGGASPDDQQRLAAVSPGGRLLLIGTASPNVEHVLASRPHDGMLLSRLADSAVAVLVPGVPGPVGSDRALRRARNLADEVTRHDARVAVAISGPLTDHIGLHPALQDDRDALAVSQGARLVTVEERWRDIGTLRLVRASQALVPGPHPVQRLQEYDDSNGTDLARTLLVWLEEAGSSAAVARRLHLHVNSVRYRVRRAHEIAGIPADDPTARLLVHVLLRGSCGDSLELKPGDGHVAR